ncbi:MAG TPA: GNAT family N-acetyltransferase [Solirubrobacterales bacterium]|nr:GNAT family N-acetyltransferase [Solirubrobacterales bacterium]
MDTAIELELVDYKADRVDRLRVAWDSLHRVHMGIAPQVAGIPVRQVEDAWRARLNKYLRWLEEPSAFAIGAHFNGEVAGYVMGRLSEGYAGWAMSQMVGRVETLAVVEGMRGKGVGSSLMTEAEGRFKKLGASASTLSVIAQNGAAIEFYGQRGYSMASVELIRHL